jgi:PDZ domain
MKCLSFAALLLFTLIISAHSSFAASCASCSSHPCTLGCDEGYNRCSEPCADCGCARATNFSYLDSVHPRVLLEEVSGRLVVVGLIEANPALNSVKDGMLQTWIASPFKLRNGCGDPEDWHAYGIRDVRLPLSSGDTAREFSMPLVPIRKIFDDAWEGAPSHEKVSGDYGPYIFGLRWAKRGGQLIVTSVLRGSPANEAGIRFGDQITEIEGHNVSEPSDDLLGKLRPSDYRKEIVIVVRNNEIEKTVRLHNEGMSQVFRHLARTGVQEQPQVASLAPAVQ